MYNNTVPIGGITLFSELFANPELQRILSRQPSSTSLAKALRNHAFRLMSCSNIQEHYFLLTILESVDWFTLAVTRISRTEFREGVKSAMHLPDAAAGSVIVVSYPIAS